MAGLVESLSALVLTSNEEPNLARTLARLAWVPRVLVLDSGSTDTTVALARQFPNVRVVERPFDTFAGQCNFGLSQLDSEWVLSLDADYLLTEELVGELRALAPASEEAGFSAGFRYCVNGRPLRGTLYPPRTVLFRRARARYVDDGHAHRVVVDGGVRSLRGRIWHDDRKPLSHWLRAQDHYAQQEVEKLLAQGGEGLSFNDRVRKTIVLGPPAAFLYTLFLKGVCLDGWAGWHYAFQRALAEALLSLRLIEARWASQASKVQGSRAKVAAD
ncbi:MAG: glycosyltransferase family 2 protein [Limisphaerales bacterium]